VSVINAWRRFAHLSGSDRATVLKFAICLAATSIALRLIGFHRWKDLLVRFAPLANSTAALDPSLLPQALHIARLASASARHLFFRTNCLEQAITLSFLLRRRGIAADLHFGARKQSAHLEAHAWVAYLGTPLNEDLGEHRHFLPFKAANPVMETLPD
jgi:hypothetical protein